MLFHFQMFSLSSSFSPLLCCVQTCWPVLWSFFHQELDLIPFFLNMIWALDEKDEAEMALSDFWQQLLEGIHLSLPFSLCLSFSVSLCLALSPRMLTPGDWPPFTEGAPASVEWKRTILIIMLILIWFVPTIKHKWGGCVSFLSKTVKPSASPFSSSKQGVQLGSSQMVEFPPVWVLEKKEANTCSRPWLFNP